MPKKILITILLSLCSSVSAVSQGLSPSCVVIGRIGDQQISIGTNRPNDRVPRPLYARASEHIVGNACASLPLNVRLQPLVRAAGEKLWNAQSLARTAGRGFEVDVDFASKFSGVDSIELAVGAFREALPTGPVPEGIVRRSLLALSEPLLIRLWSGAPRAYVTHVGERRTDDIPPFEVGCQTPVSVRTLSFPPGAVVLLTVHPMQPWTDRIWVMPETLHSAQGTIMSHIGRCGEDDSFKFEITAAVLWPEDLPPFRQDGIQLLQWQEYSKRFLNQSAPVNVVRWEGAERITHIGALRVPPTDTTTFVVAAEPQTEVLGTVRRSLQQGEKIWLIALPQAGEPWVAGWTERIEEGGRWRVVVTQLSQKDKVAIFDLVAVLSDGDPKSKDRLEMIEWIFQAQFSAHPVRVRVTERIGR